MKTYSSGSFLHILAGPCSLHALRLTTRWVTALLKMSTWWIPTSLIHFETVALSDQRLLQKASSPSSPTMKTTTSFGDGMVMI